MTATALVFFVRTAFLIASKDSGEIPSNDRTCVVVYAEPVILRLTISKKKKGKISKTYSFFHTPSLYFPIYIYHRRHTTEHNRTQCAPLAAKKNSRQLLGAPYFDLAVPIHYESGQSFICIRIVRIVFFIPRYFKNVGNSVSHSLKIVAFATIQLKSSSPSSK